MRYNIFLTAILMFCLSTLPCSAEFRGNIIQTGVVNGIQTDDDAKLNSLGVNYNASGEAGTLTLDKIEAGDLTEALVIKSPTGSTSDDVLILKSEDGTEITTFGSDGGVEMDFLDVALYAEMPLLKVAEIQPKDDGQPVVIELQEGNYSTQVLVIKRADGEVVATINTGGGLTINYVIPKLYLDNRNYLRIGKDWNIKAFGDEATKLFLVDDEGNVVAQGGLEVGGNIAPDTDGTLYLGYDGSSIKRFLQGYFTNNDVSGEMRAGYFRSSSGDMEFRARDNFGIVLMEQDDGVDRCKLTTAETDVNSIDTIFTVYDKLLAAHTYRWDDSANKWVFSDGVAASGAIEGQPVDSLSYMTSTQGYYGDTTSDPSKHPQGINYPEQTAPSAPSSGGTIYFDSTAQELRFKDSSGNEFTVDLTPVP